jgi:hypothetical protein
MSSLFCERDLYRACDKLTALERFAKRRERFLDALDFEALDLQTQREIEMADELVNDDLAFGHLYVEHLAELIATGS